MKMIKDMPLDWNGLYKGAEYCFRTLESMKNYNEYCKEHGLKKTQNMSGAWDTAVKLCDSFVRMHSVQNRILNRPMWQDNLRYFWQRGYRRRKKYIHTFYFILTELQDRVEELQQELFEAKEPTRIGF